MTCWPILNWQWPGIKQAATATDIGKTKPSQSICMQLQHYAIMRLSPCCLHASASGCMLCLRCSVMRRDIVVLLTVLRCLHRHLLVQAACLARCNGAKADLCRHGSFSEESFRHTVQDMCTSEQEHLIVSYSRKEFLQTGWHSALISGHQP